MFEQEKIIHALDRAFTLICNEMQYFILCGGTNNSCKISNNFSTVKYLDKYFNISCAWEIIRETMRTTRIHLQAKNINITMNLRGISLENVKQIKMYKNNFQLRNFEHLAFDSVGTENYSTI
jgi:hypothetical protein